MTQKIIQGDCLSVMEQFPDNHFSTIITNSPYGLKFMGKEWDHGVAGIEYWKEMLRICTPGAWLLSFGGTRTYHRMTCAIEDAGWEIRDCIMWVYGSGFPKGKGCLKPAYEPIIMARKKGKNPRLNIDDSRVGSEELSSQIRGKGRIGTFKGTEGMLTSCRKGRWPANVILDEESGEMLDEQSGILKSGSGDKHNKNQQGGYGGNFKRMQGVISASSLGGASRFFYCAKASPSERNEGLEGAPLQDAGIKNTSGRGYSESDPYKQVKYRNPHPTVKPLRLMQYLIKLVTPADGLILDPFAGSGTTLIAASRLGFSAIGIEKEADYVKIASKRLKAQFIQQLEFNI